MTSEKSVFLNICKNIDNLINDHCFAIIHEKNSEIRKKLHAFAKSKGYFHASYLDESQNFDKEVKYWCESCVRYLHVNEHRVYNSLSNCDSNTNSQPFIYCSRCFEDNDLYNREIIVKDGFMYEEGYHEAKLINKNNTIIISKDKKYIQKFTHDFAKN
jgi:hypothetical protein